MNPLIRVYLMGYEPPGWDMEKVAQGKIEKMMARADVCATFGVGESWPVGTIRVADADKTFFAGHADEHVMKLGVPYRCVAHEYDGKIAIVEQATAEMN